MRVGVLSCRLREGVLLRLLRRRRHEALTSSRRHGTTRFFPDVVGWEESDSGGVGLEVAFVPIRID